MPITGELTWATAAYWCSHSFWASSSRDSHVACVLRLYRSLSASKPHSSSEQRDSFKQGIYVKNSKPRERRGTSGREPRSGRWSGLLQSKPFLPEPPRDCVARGDINLPCCWTAEMFVAAVSILKWKWKLPSSLSSSNPKAINKILCPERAQEPSQVNPP